MVVRHVGGVYTLTNCLFPVSPPAALQNPSQLPHHYESLNRLCAQQPRSHANDDRIPHHDTHAGAWILGDLQVVLESFVREQLLRTMMSGIEAAYPGPRRWPFCVQRQLTMVA